MPTDPATCRAVPTLLATQLLAAEVYAHFLAVSSAGETWLWKKMLDDELDHIAHLRGVMHEDLPETLSLPKVNVGKMREVCAYALRMGDDLFLLRLEGALRVECAELDYGLEGLVARRLERNRLVQGYHGDISSHLADILDESARYMESPNIGLQARRLRELLETSLRDTSHIPAAERLDAVDPAADNGM